MRVPQLLIRDVASKNSASSSWRTYQTTKLRLLMRSRKLAGRLFRYTIWLSAIDKRLNHGSNAPERAMRAAVLTCESQLSLNSCNSADSPPTAPYGSFSGGYARL